MKIWKNVIVVVAAVGATTLLTQRVVSQDYKKELEKKTGELRKQVEKEVDNQLGGQDAMDEEMAAWLKYGEPGPQHERMAKWVGTWKQETKHWMAPGTEPTISTSTARYKEVMGGRYFTEKMTGTLDFMGESHEFEGFGLFGYDNIKQKYFFTWIDNMSTMIMIGVGEEDETGAIVYYSEMPNPMDGSTQKVKSISRELSDDQTTFEMHMGMPDGTWFKQMELVATRKP